MHGFIKHERARLGGERPECLGACRRARRRKSLEHEAVGRQARHRKRGDQRHRPGHRACSHAGCERGPHEAEAGIADCRRAGIGDECQARAAAQTLDQRGYDIGLIVIVQRKKRAIDAELRQQPARVPGILGDDEISGRQRFAHPRAGIAKVADRCRDDLEPPRGLPARRLAHVATVAGAL